LIFFILYLILNMELYQTYDIWETEENKYKLFLLTKKHNDFVLLCQMFMGTLYYIYFYNLYLQNIVILSKLKTNLHLTMNNSLINNK